MMLGIKMKSVRVELGGSKMNEKVPSEPFLTARLDAMK